MTDTVQWMNLSSREKSDFDSTYRTLSIDPSTPANSSFYFPKSYREYKDEYDSPNFEQTCDQIFTPRPCDLSCVEPFFHFHTDTAS